MRSNFPLFRSDIQPRKLWKQSRVIEDTMRHFQISQWENRLICHEHLTQRLWATLDCFAGEDPREFWQSCLESQRIARFTTARRGFEPERNGRLRLHLNPHWFDVLVNSDGSGLARIQGGTQWHEFAPFAPRRVRNPLAWRPSIWSPHFQLPLKFERRGLRSLQPVFLAHFVQQMPASIREIAQQGHSSLMVQRVAAAIAQEWITYRPRQWQLPEFWAEALNYDSPAQLPTRLLENFELTPGVEINLWTWTNSSRQATLFWQNSMGTLHLEFWTHFDSSHEELEAKLHLRDWLAQFFSPDEVTRFFDS